MKIIVTLSPPPRSVNHPFSQDARWKIPQRDGSPRPRPKGRRDHKIETLFSKLNAPLKLYYTHAYAAWEKGSIENANRHVRRWYPKETDFSCVSAHAIRALQDFINSIPRQTLQGASAHEAILAIA